jgi:hypothetical protein
VAVTGNIQEISLSSLAQIICLEKRKAVITLNHRGQEGKIYFENGNATHASVGSKIGEDAFYTLIGWLDADFLMSEYTSLPQITIHAPLSHLLMEAMRRIDENQATSGGVFDSHQLLSPEDIERDSTLEGELISLISNLEHIGSLLGDRKKTNKPDVALGHLFGILNKIAAFPQAPTSNDEALPTLPEVIAHHSVEFPSLRSLQMNLNDTTNQVEITNTSIEGDTIARVQAYQQIYPGVISVVDSYLSAVLQSFHSSDTSNQWKETVTDFLADLSNVAESVQF